jgi:hypothetical protein
VQAYHIPTAFVQSPDADCPELIPAEWREAVAPASEEDRVWWAELSFELAEREDELEALRYEELLDEVYGSGRAFTDGDFDATFAERCRRDYTPGAWGGLR